MIATTLVEKIWLQAEIAPSYLAEIQRICLQNQASSYHALDELPLLFCDLNGGDKEQVVSVITAWNLLRYAARLLDDVEDGDTRSRNMSEPVALNLSTGLLFTVGMVLNSLESIGLPSEAASDIRCMFYKELLQVCSGQHLDLTQQAPTLDESWQIAGAKSGVFMGLICWAGGRVADAYPEQLELYRQFGYNLGLLDQIKDDLADLWSNESYFSDLQNGRYGSLPVAYALSVLPDDERQKLLMYLANSHDTPEAEKQTRELIIRSGAGVYLTVQSAYYFRQSQQLLEKMALPANIHIKLNTLLEKLRLPATETSH